MFRNNVGVLINKFGVPVRFGLANDSKLVNEKIKSSDLIGIRPITITQEMVGTTIGQFVSLELKKENWKESEKGREIAQKAWIDLINANGGYAKFINNVEDL